MSQFAEILAYQFEANDFANFSTIAQELKT
jgi:hypothetical protein